MSDNEMLLIVFVCLCGGYLLGRAHAFVIENRKSP